MLSIHKQALTKEEFSALYSAVGWDVPLPELIEIALANSAFTVCIKEDGKPVGMGRTIGDGALSFFIKDVAVLPDYQGKGIGKMIMEAIFTYIKETVPKGAFVSAELISALGKEAFYEKFGFGKKPGDGMGYGMMALVIGE